jgi:hypothetical protein
MASGAVLRVDRRHWPDVTSKIGRAVVATLLHDPEMAALHPPYSSLHENVTCTFRIPS